MPQRRPGHLPTRAVDDFDPVAGGIGPVPCDLTVDGFFERGRAGCFVGAEDGEVERAQGRRRVRVGGPFYLDELAEFGVGGEFVEVEGHCFGDGGGLVLGRI